MSVMAAAAAGSSVMLTGAVATVWESEDRPIAWWLVTPEDVVRLVLPMVTIPTLDSDGRVRIVGTVRAARTRGGSRIVDVTCADRAAR